MKRILFFFGFIFLISGCKEQVELKQLGIVVGFGVDKVDNGYLVTTQIINSDAIGGENSNALPVFGLSAEGETIYEAFKKIDNHSILALYLSQLHVIVVDEATAKEGLEPVLDFALRHTEIRPDITLLVAYEETSYDVLNVLIPSDRVPVTQLDIYVSMVETHTGRLVTDNLYDTVNSVNKTGYNAVLNAVSINSEQSPNKEEKQSSNSEEQDVEMDVASSTENISKITSPANLEVKHFAVFNQDKLVGYLNDEDIQLYNILKNRDKHYVLKQKVNDDHYVTLEVDQVDTQIHTEIEERKVTINCKINGVLAENRYPMDLTANHNVKVLEEYLSKQLEKDFLDLIDKTQTELKTDILSIGSHIYYWENTNWLQIKGYWEEIYPTLDIEFKVDVKIDNIGDIENLHE